MKNKSKNTAKPSVLPPVERSNVPEAPPANPQNEEQPGAAPHPRFPIAALCASAGGLETLQEFFDNMPPDSGMALVVITHLHPSHISRMSELLQKHTRMPVLEIEDSMLIQPNHVYVIPPRFELGIIHGVFQLLDLPDSEVRVTIDTFLRSLALDQGRQAMAVILSGSGHDGSLGLKDIKEQGGLAVTQDPETALHAGMPRSAENTGLVDFVLPVAQIPRQLLAYIQQSGLQEDITGQAPVVIPAEALQKIFMLLRAHTNHDFSHYKKSTIQRRLIRRMAITNTGQINDYVAYLRRHPPELETLFKEFLIGVTQFFRDPEAFVQLKEKVFSPLLAEHAPDQPFRIWVPGCATGEEAYSLAILLKEEMEQHQKNCKVQIFATDIDAAAIERARRPVFPASIARDVSPERLKSFFIREDDTYTVRADIRDMVVFAPQNLLSDPPFSNLDLISCRNVLIYLEPALQYRVLALCHYSLKPKGYLLLGPSETLGELAYAFNQVDRKWRIFQRVNGITVNHPLDTDYFGPSSSAQTTSIASGEYRLSGEYRSSGKYRSSGEYRSFGEYRSPGEYRAPGPKKNYHELVEQQLLKHFESTAALLNKNYDLLYTYGNIDNYLKLSAGQASLNILELARPGLKSELATALRQLDGEPQVLVRRNVRVQTGEKEQFFDLTLQYMADFHQILLIFEPPANPAPPPKKSNKRGQPSLELAQELMETKQYLQNTVENLQTANEELKSANEELQSANEELKTAREEEQSVNEELSTVNAELQVRNEELTNAKNDLNNLLVGIRIATIFLDEDLHLRNFTPQATHLFNLIETDIGRPLEHVTSKLLYQHLIQDAAQVLRTLDRQEKEVRSETGQWYNMRLMPYRTLDNVIDGVVLTFEEITGQKETEQQLRQANHTLARLGVYTQNIINTVPDGLMILSEELRILSANRSFYSLFNLQPAQAEGELLYDLDNGSWDVPELRRLLDGAADEDESFKNIIITAKFPRLGRRTLRLNGRRLLGERDDVRLLFVVEDISEAEEISQAEDISETQNNG